MKKEKMNEPNIEKKQESRQILIPKHIWISLLGLFLVMMIVISVSAHQAYQQPVQTTESYPTVSYTSISKYDYTAFLQNNTVYNKTELSPGEGIIFKKLVNSINGSYQYTFQIDQPAVINISVIVKAVIQTDIWTKSYIIYPMNTSVGTGRSHSINAFFPINFMFYDAVVKLINEETGINAQSPQLSITSYTTVVARTENDTIYESSNPELTMTLNQKTVEFSEQLSQQKSKRELQNRIIDHPEVIELRKTRSYSLIFMSIVLVAFVSLIGIQPSTVSQYDRKLEKMMKKYGDWIIKADTNPIDKKSKKIRILSIDELSRISEGLSKPIFHYQRKNKSHVFLVMDNERIYQYTFTADEKKSRSVSTFFNWDFLHKSKIPWMFYKSKSKPVISTKEQQKVIGKTVTCKKCKSSFHIQEEGSNKTMLIQMPCPHCGHLQRISLKKPMRLKNKIKLLFHKDKSTPSAN